MILFAYSFLSLRLFGGKQAFSRKTLLQKPDANLKICLPQSNSRFTVSLAV
jgi:hypothetical protein